MPVIVPITGSDLSRLATTAKRRVGEIHTTTQHRVFLKDVCVSPKFLGSVANEAAMLALNSNDDVGCFPGDECVRDDTGSIWKCVLNRGTAVSDWNEIGEDFVSNGPFTGTPPSDAFSAGSFVTPATDRLFGGTFEQFIVGSFF